MIKVIEGLYQSGFPDFAEIIKENIQAVIYLARRQRQLPDDVSPGENFLYIWWPIEDGSVPDTRILEGLADLAVRFLKDGLRVLISCAVGINRSSLLVSLVMMKYLQIDPQEAIDQIRAKNPLALSNEDFYNWLRERQTS